MIELNGIQISDNNINTKKNVKIYVNENQLGNIADKEVLASYVAKADILDTTGSATDKVMSQHGVTKAINGVNNEVTELQTQINGKQDALTLTVKDNGNIVISNIQGQSKEFMPATPSGDPMHYAYVAAGAEYNDTGADIVKNTPWADLADDDADKTVVHKAGYWYLNGLGDITTEQMRMIFVETNNFLSSVQSTAEALYSQMLSRVNLPLVTYKITTERMRVTFYDAFRSSLNLEALVIPEYSSGTAPEACFRPINIRNMFIGDIKLKFISGMINLINCESVDSAFVRCDRLRIVKLYSIKDNINISYSPELTLKSILYMINNEKATSPITITLHADVYNKCMANADILAALQAHTNVSLASA